MNGAPLLADVAALAGVSIATASRVLSGTGRVSDVLAAKVTAASLELGYRRNAIASSLRTQSTGLVSLILPRYSTQFFAELGESVSTALDDRDVSTVLRYFTHTEDSEAQNAEDRVTEIDALLSRRVDAVIASPPTEALAHELVERCAGTPLVLIGRYLVGPDADSVGLDEDAAASLLTEHLHSSGARTLSVLGFDRKIAADARRVSAIEHAARESGLELTIVDGIENTVAGGIRAAQGVGETSSAAKRAGASLGETAVLCAGDDQAHGLLTALEMHGVSVPDDVQVVSFMAMGLLPVGAREVTSLLHPWAGMGREAVRLLTSEAGEQGPGNSGVGHRRVALTPVLAEGKSTRPRAWTGSRALHP